MPETNMQPFAEAIEETMDLAQQAIERTRTEIARSQALSQAEAELARSIERIADKHDTPPDERDGAARRSGKKKAPVVSRGASRTDPWGKMKGRCLRCIQTDVLCLFGSFLRRLPI
jgi:septal ring factor EnvC (AmiA/AmiB activator)